MDLSSIQNSAKMSFMKIELKHSNLSQVIKNLLKGNLENIDVSVNELKIKLLELINLDIANIKFAKFGRTSNINIRKSGYINNSTNDTYKSHIDEGCGAMIELVKFSGNNHLQNAKKVEKFFNSFGWHDFDIVDKYGGKCSESNATFIYFFCSVKKPVTVERDQLSRQCKACKAFFLITEMMHCTDCKRFYCKSVCQNIRVHAINCESERICIICNPEICDGFDNGCQVEICAEKYDQIANEEAGEYDVSNYYSNEEEEINEEE
jgi:hypothetical protein